MSGDSDSLNLLTDPKGFVECLVAVGEALDFHHHAHDLQARRILKRISIEPQSVEELKQDVSEYSTQLKNSVALEHVMDARDSLSDEPQNISQDKVELLIKQLLFLKQCPQIIYAIILRYPRYDNQVGTQGFPAKSSEDIPTIIKRIDAFLRAAQAIPYSEVTAYIWVQIRGRYDSRIENFASATLTTIATEVCGFAGNIELENSSKSQLEPTGSKTIVLLKSEEPTKILIDPDVDVRKRVFLIGETRTGKSTVGNAIMRQDEANESQGSITSASSSDQDSVSGGLHFMEAKGMTGTLSITQANYHEQIENKETGKQQLTTVEIYDTPGFKDKDGLDMLHQTTIEDKISVKEKVSTFIMTVSIDSGITISSQEAISKYQDMFGDNMNSMLVLVLTSNEEICEEGLTQRRLDHWPDITKYLDGFSEENLYLVSLSDLREKTKTPSDEVITKIKEKILGMPLNMTENFKKQLELLLQDVDENNKEIQNALETFVMRGWNSYADLEEKYIKSGYSKMTSSFAGFVYRAPVSVKMILNIGNLLQASKWKIITGRTVIELKTWDDRSKQALEKFISEHREKSQRYDNGLMKKLGDYLKEQWLEVFVKKNELDEASRKQWATVYDVYIFDRTIRRHHKLRKTIEEMLEGKKDTLRPELVKALPDIKVINPTRKTTPQMIRRNTKEDWNSFYMEICNTGRSPPMENTTEPDNIIKAALEEDNVDTP